MTCKEIAYAFRAADSEAPVIVEVGGRYYEVVSVTIPTSGTGLGLSALIKVLEPLNGEGKNDHHADPLPS